MRKPVRQLLGGSLSRRMTQIGSLIVLNMYIFQAKWLCLPVMNCHSCPVATTACPIGVIGHFSEIQMLPILAIGMLLLVGAVVGRFFCGWVCPFGFLQDLFYRIPSEKFRIPRPFLGLKYVALFGLVIFVPFFFGSMSPFFYCRTCPVGTLQSTLPRGFMAEGGLVLEGWTWVRLFVLVLVFVLVIGSKRFFCRVWCPIGAFVALTNRFSQLSLHYGNSGCPSCRKCTKVCPQDIDVDKMRAGRRGKDHAAFECILCMECTKSCPIPGTLDWRWTQARTRLERAIRWGMVGGVFLALVAVGISRFVPYDGEIALSPIEAELAVHLDPLSVAWGTAGLVIGFFGAGLMGAFVGTKEG